MIQPSSDIVPENFTTEGMDAIDRFHADDEKHYLALKCNKELKGHGFTPAQSIETALSICALSLQVQTKTTGRTAPNIRKAYLGCLKEIVEQIAMALLADILPFRLSSDEAFAKTAHGTSKTVSAVLDARACHADGHCYQHFDLFQNPLIHSIHVHFERRSSTPNDFLVIVRPGVSVRPAELAAELLIVMGQMVTTVMHRFDARTTEALDAKSHVVWRDGLSMKRLNARDWETERRKLLAADQLEGHGALASLLASVQTEGMPTRIPDAPDASLYTTLVPLHFGLGDDVLGFESIKQFKPRSKIHGFTFYLCAQARLKPGDQAGHSLCTRLLSHQSLETRLKLIINGIYRAEPLQTLKALPLKMAAIEMVAGLHYRAVLRGRTGIRWNVFENSRSRLALETLARAILLRATKATNCKHRLTKGEMDDRFVRFEPDRIFLLAQMVHAGKPRSCYPIPTTVLAPSNSPNCPWAAIRACFMASAIRFNRVFDCIGHLLMHCEA